MAKKQVNFDEKDIKTYWLLVPEIQSKFNSLIDFCEILLKDKPQGYQHYEFLRDDLKVAIEHLQPLEKVFGAKMKAMEAHNLYTKSKTAESEEERKEQLKKYNEVRKLKV